MATLTVSEYASKFKVNESTVRYRIKTGKLQSEMIDGKLHVVFEDEEITSDLQENYIKQIEQLLKQIEYLQEELSQSLQRERESRESADAIIQQIQQDAESAKQRSDTIILQLTRQFEEQTKLLEDMRKERASGLWARVKTAFGFAPS
jgi:predicted DNA-binding protein YlxM (UPF0122 family)